MIGDDEPAHVVKLTLLVSAAYTAVVGLALLLFPSEFGWGAVPPDPPEELLALLRLLGSPFLGIAALNWLSRNARPETMRSVLLANLVGFGAVAANDVWGVFSGSAREIAAVFLVVHVVFAVAFIFALRQSSRVPSTSDRN